MARSSHNTFMSLLVEQGILGAGLYILLLLWIARRTFALRGSMRESTGLVPITYAATVAILGAITVGDLFVDYLKFETRVWFLALMMVVERMELERQNAVLPIEAEPDVKQGQRGAPIYGAAQRPRRGTRHV